MENTYFIAQWRNSDGTWSESAGFGNGSENQQLHYAEQAGIEDPLSQEGAREFSRVLAGANYGTRIVKRTEEIVG